MSLMNFIPMMNLRNKMQLIFGFSSLTAPGRVKTLFHSIKKGFTIKYGFPPPNAIRGENIKPKYI